MEPSKVVELPPTRLVALAAVPSMLVIPVRTKAPEDLFRVTAVVPMYTVELPKTADGIVPERLPAVREVKLAPLMAPKLPDQVPEVIVPTDVKDEAVIVEPKVEPLKTVVLLICKAVVALMVGAITEVPKYPVLGLVAPEAPMSKVLSVKRRLPVRVPPPIGR